MYRNRPVRSDDLTDLNSIHPYEFVNLNAVPDTYRHGDIKVKDDQVTVWFAGRLVIGAIDRHKQHEKDLVDKVAEWREKYGPGRVWVEEVYPYLGMNILSVYRVSDLLLAHSSLSPNVELSNSSL
jgi:hypothetical protein